MGVTHDIGLRPMDKTFKRRIPDVDTAARYLILERVQRGWQPYGDPFSHAGQLLQAAVLTADSGKRIRKTSEDKKAITI